MKAISVEELSKTFSGGTVAVDGIRFSLNQGEIFGFLGPNGVGKTTTVKLLCGMLTPSGGKCQVLGIDPTQNPEQLHEKVGVVTEHAQMYDHMTAWENLQFYGTLFGMSRSECADRAKLLLHRLELADVKDRKLATYSTGMRRRSAFVLVLTQAPNAASDFQKLLDMLPVADGEHSQQQRILGLILNNIMPPFFLIVPIMTSSVMAASSFVGEKEKHTLETLLYSPLSLRQLFQSKILAGLSVGIMISYISFAAMLLVVEMEVFFLTGNLIIPSMSWLIIMLLIAPSFSLVAIAVTVRSSAKAKTIEEAQQRAVFLIFPILALVIGQFTGILLINSWLLLGLGAVLVVLDVLLMRGAAGNFTYEKLLK